MYLHHSLVDDGVSPGLADHQVSPLYDDNGDKEGGMAGVLEHLTLGIGLKIQNKALVITGHIRHYERTTYMVVVIIEQTED